MLHAAPDRESTSPIDTKRPERSVAQPPGDVSQLRWIATAFDSAQTQRVRAGERLRTSAFANGADGWTPRGSDPEAVLARLRAGTWEGPVTALGQAYRRHWEEERELLRMLSDEVAQHPVWPWLGRIRGVGPSLAARLLARLDVERAPTPSSFWAYCGLATVVAQSYRCDLCGHEVTVAAGRPLRSAHRAPGTGEPCHGTLAQVAGAASRVAQPRPMRGESASYDREAKKLCYLIGVSFARQGGAYRRYYLEQRSRLESAKPDWIPRRRHLTALRMTEKLFLAHLWLVWRERLGLPVTAPYGQTHVEAAQPPEAWAMVDA